MDEMTAFDQQIAREVVREAGPSGPVDGAAILAAVTSTGSPRWGLTSMFSATKLVAATAIVALFGGFLLAGVLTQGQDEPSLPGAAPGRSPAAEQRAEHSPPPGAEGVFGASMNVEPVREDDPDATEHAPMFFYRAGSATGPWALLFASDEDWCRRTLSVDLGLTVDEELLGRCLDMVAGGFTGNSTDPPLAILPETWAVRIAKKAGWYGEDDE